MNVAQLAARDRREPRALVALLLSDVVQSTRHWQTDVVSMRAALHVLDGVVADGVAGAGGQVVKSRGEGDSHFAAFPLASDAVAAAVAVQRRLVRTEWPTETPLRVRVGVHVGEVWAPPGDYLGTPVNHAARLRGAAHGGQILCSRAVVDLAGAGDGGTSFVRLGRYRLRDVPGWTELFQVRAAGIPARFAPPVTLDTSLPPVSAIAMLDAVGTTARVETLTPREEHALMTRLGAIIEGAFGECDGDYLKLLGDGCVALFADPDAALVFLRTASERVRAVGVDARAALHVDRVDFAGEEPTGRGVRRAALLLRHVPDGGVAMSSVAATLVTSIGDAVVADAS